MIAMCPGAAGGTGTIACTGSFGGIACCNGCGNGAGGPPCTGWAATAGTIAGNTGRGAAITIGTGCTAGFGGGGIAALGIAGGVAIATGGKGIGNGVTS